MSAERNKMIDMLQQLVVPVLRAARFKGSFPHFRRHIDTHIDLLTFQFDKHGGGFVVEITECPLEGITTYWGKEIPPNEVRAWDVNPRKRKRLGASSPNEDFWFRYDQKNIFESNLYESAAKLVLYYLEKETVV